MARLTPLCYIFHGSDVLTITETLNELKRRLGPPDAIELNTTVLNGRAITLSELRHACHTVPFLAEKRLIVVEHMLTPPGASQDEGGEPVLSRSQQELFKGLCELLASLPETARLIFVEHKALPPKHPVLQFVQTHERGYVREFNVPDPRDLPGWVEKRVRAHGATIERPAAVELADRVSNTPRYLDDKHLEAITSALEQEIVKLITYTGGEHPITLADVEAVCSYTHPAIVFDLTDALGTRDGRKAAWAIHRLLDEGQPSSKHPLEILATIAGHFRALLSVKELRAAGATVQDVAKTLGMGEFRARKLYSQTTYFSDAQLERVLRHLLDMDVAIKTGAIPDDLALDVLVAGLAAPEE